MFRDAYFWTAVMITLLCGHELTRGRSGNRNMGNSAMRMLSTYHSNSSPDSFLSDETAG